MTARPRDTMFPARLTVTITAEMHGRLAAAATRNDTSTAALARDALERGLPLALEARRKAAARQTARQAEQQRPESVK